MAQHVLSLEAPDTLNGCILRIQDTSVYNSQISAICPLLQVTLPGFNIPVRFTDELITIGFSLNLTACDLKLQTVNCGTKYNDLPDGIYILRYSVSPNDIVYVEYNHLRITCALNRIEDIYCSLDLAACDPPEKVKNKLQQVRLIQQYLKAAKSEVETCHHPSRGMELYRYAMKLIDKMNCKPCKC